MRLPLLIATPLFVVSSVLLTGCVSINLDHGSSDRYQEDFHFSYDLEPNGHVVAEAFNGKVEVVGWDENRVDISGTKYGSTERLRDSIKVETHNSPTLVEVRAIHPSVTMGSSGARMIIKVPRQAVVERITSSNGGVSVEHVGTVSHLKTSNGSIHVADSSGDLDARTSNGPIQVERLKGTLSARSSNGKITAEAVSGTCDVETSNSPINVRMEAATSAPMRLVTSNGSIELVLEKPPTGNIRAQSSNSSITVKLPTNAAARITADTSNASISTEFEVLTQFRGEQGKKDHLAGTIGSGGPTIDLTTSNGRIRILKTSNSEN